MARVAAVTGGAGAIGGAIAAGLRAAGHEVAVLDRSGDPPVDLAERGEVQAAAAALLSDSAGAITGQALCADGGLVLR
jgi:nucleoside-diphosphate-sugar epimerase